MFSIVLHCFANHVSQVSQIRVLQGFANTKFYICFGRFARFLTQILFSTADFSSLCDPRRISTGKTSLCVWRVIWEQSPLELPALCPHPQLRRGVQRRARRSFRCGQCPRHPPPPPPQQAAALCLPVPPLQRPVTLRSVRHWQKGTTPALSVIRSRALATVADCGI